MRTDRKESQRESQESQRASGWTAPVADREPLTPSDTNGATALKRLLEYLDALDQVAALIRSKAADEKCYLVQE